MASVILTIIIGVVILIGFLVWYLRNLKKDYWKKRGVPEVNSSLLKNLYLMATRKKTLVEFDVDTYNEMGSNKVAGSVDLGIVSLYIKDPELIKHFLVKDFDHFMDRRTVEVHSEKIFNLTLLALEGQKWKNVRSVISPTFTTGKIRRMFEYFNNCGANLVEFIKSKPVGSPGTRDVVVKEAFSRYLTDVIGSTAFGMETNSLKDPNSVFYKMAEIQSQFSFLKLLKMITVWILPFLTRFGLRMTDSEPIDFFENICKTALKNRESSLEKRDDFLQLMVEARRGDLKIEESEMDSFEKDAQLEKSEDLKGKAKGILTDDICTAQSLLFFIAGLDTTGSVLNFTVYILALHPDIQSKLYEEVNKVMMDNDGQIDYDSIVHMEYMDKVVSEILRMYPPGIRLERKCTKDYQLPGTDVVVEKGIIVVAAVKAIHMDPQYYPDPEKFDPERFTTQERAKRNPYTYMPFGHGPRNCIGMRFALMEAKVALAYLVYNFSIEPCESTPVPIKIDPTMGTRPVVDLEIRFKTR